MLHRVITTTHSDTIISRGALPVLSGYDRVMIDKGREGLPEEGGVASATSDEMAEALDSMKSASPSLAGTIDAAHVTPEGLAGSHDRATPDEHDAAQSATGERNER